MKNIKNSSILCLILFLPFIGCSDYYNGAYVEEDQYMEDNLDERADEVKVETKIFYEEKKIAVNELGDLRLEAIKAVEDAEQKRRDVEGEIEIDYENKRKQNIDPYKDSELEKRDKAGNKTYWENE